MGRVRIIAAGAVLASLALHIGTGGALIYVSQNKVEQEGGDTPIEVSLDPTAASGGNGPPIDAGPAQPPPEAAASPPQQTIASSEPPKQESQEPPPKDPAREPPPTEQPKEVPPQEQPKEPQPQEQPKAAQPPEQKPPEQAPAAQGSKPPIEQPKEAVPATAGEPPPPVIKSAPDTDTPEVVANEPPPPSPTPPTPQRPQPPPPKPPPPKPPPPRQVAAIGGPSGGATATGRERTAVAGSAAVRGAELSCAMRARGRLRHPTGQNPRAFKIQIVIARSGAIVSVRLLSSSGSPAADQAAIRAMQSSGPFPPCPGIAGVMQLDVPFPKSR